MVEKTAFQIHHGASLFNFQDVPVGTSSYFFFHWTCDLYICEVRKLIIWGRKTGQSFKGKTRFQVNFGAVKHVAIT